MEDYIIRNIKIYDGTGKAGCVGSISISDDKITGVYRSQEPPVSALHEIQGEGLCAAPGFVDTHTHSDMYLLHDGRQPSSISQGVTTEILGQDGLSYAPLSIKNLKDYARYIKGLDGQFDDVALDFTSAKEYLQRFSGKIGVNVAWLIPHCALRLETAGFQNRLLDSGEMSKACGMIAEAMDQGAKGFSTGLSYFPGAFSDTEELIQLCKAVREKDGVYVTHLRSVFQGKPFDRVEEALNIARKSGVKLHFSHYRTGSGTIGQTEKIMSKIDEGIDEGLDISLELYPYPYGASFAPMFIPPWANDGGFDAIMARLGDPCDREKIIAYIDSEFADFDGMITYAGIHGDLMGKTFSELAEENKVSKGEMIARLLYSEHMALSFHDVDPGLSGEETKQFHRDVLELLSRPNYMVGSDAIHVGAYPHPRAWGTFAKVLRLAREEKFELEKLINRLTDLPCRRFKLEKRGRIEKGYFADVVIFNPDTVTEHSTIEDPRLAAEGIEYVFVNGQLALSHGQLIGNLAGRVL